MLFLQLQCVVGVQSRLENWRKLVTRGEERRTRKENEGIERMKENGITEGEEVLHKKGGRERSMSSKENSIMSVSAIIIGEGREEREREREERRRRKERAHIMITISSSRT